ncbi:hypothetical protein V5T82_00980 [Magnetovibrio sp. PR-2]|uniref:hypothetical protein n=1 Tax=Magnetovibrio sp. PR-2 TaxID=3120356 RepID=UPI002FCDE420
MPDSQSPLSKDLKKITQSEADAQTKNRILSMLGLGALFIITVAIYVANTSGDTLL